MDLNKNHHFVGIGGSGMSALAQILVGESRVSGSDRSWPAEDPIGLFSKLRRQGIALFPQDGAGISPQTDRVILSTAIEKENPDLLQAKRLKKEIWHRSDLLAHLVNQRTGIAVGGTSGKSTICGMLGVMLEELGHSPTVVNGGEIINFISGTQLGNSKKGKGPYFVVEADESDGTLIKYFPCVSILSNMAQDHKPLAELEKIFTQFVTQTQDVFVYNLDCPLASKIHWPIKKSITYAVSQNAHVRAQNIQLSLEDARFEVDGVKFTLRVPGRHNVENALAAIAAGMALGIPLRKMVPALAAFRGIRRRLELIARQNHCRVYDDFAHNPDKIRATLRALAPFCPRLLVIFQPHGYTPTRFLFDGYARVFAEELREKDVLFLLPIFDAGGTADRSISSKDLADEIQKKHILTFACAGRQELLEKLRVYLRRGDTFVVMGARDNTLTFLCGEIAALLPEAL